MEEKRIKRMRMLTILAGGILWGAMFNPVYMKYILYDGMIEAMKVNNTQLGFLITVYSIAVTVILLPAGIIADKYNPKKIIVISAILNGLLCFVFAMDMTNFTMAIIVWALFAITNGGCFYVCDVRMVRIISPKKDQAQNYGIFEGIGGLAAMGGNFLALYLFSKFLDPVAGVRAAMISMGVVCIVGALLVQFLYNEKKLLVEKEEKKTEPEEAFSLKSAIAVFKNPGVYLLTIIVFGIYGMNGTLSYLTPYFTEVFGVAAVFSGALGTVRTYGTRLVGAPFGGFMAEKLRSSVKLTVFGGVILLVLIFAMQSIPATASYAVTLGVVLVLAIAFTNFTVRGVYWSIMDEIDVPEQYSGTAISIITILGLNLADMILPPLCGKWMDQYGVKGYDHIFTLLYCLAGAALISAVIIMAMKKSAHKKVEAEA